MDEAQANYTKVLKRLDELGFKGEAGQQDARYLLPNAAETKIVVTMNARELLHFLPGALPATGRSGRSGRWRSRCWSS